MSHDDIIDKDYILNNVMCKLSNKDMGMWHSPIWWFENDTGKKNIEPSIYQYNGVEDLKIKMLERSVINCPSVFFTRKLLSDVGTSKPEYMNAGDYEHFLRIIDSGYYIYSIKHFLGYYYGVNDNQCTTSIHTKNDGYDISKLQLEYKNKWGIK